MSDFRAYTIGVLTILMLASFASAQNARPPGMFRENAEWTYANGLLEHGPQASAQPLEIRGAFGDTLLSFEYRAPVGAGAKVDLMGRYTVELPGKGDWTPVLVRLRGPRFDAGYNKVENALALELRVG